MNKKDIHTTYELESYPKMEISVKKYCSYGLWILIFLKPSECTYICDSSAQTPRFPDGEDNCKYFECKKGVLIRKSCPPGKKWANGFCTPLRGATCAVHFDCKDFPNANFPYGLNRCKYFTCSTEKITSQSCPSGKKWSQEQRRCVEFGEGETCNSKSNFTDQSETSVCKDGFRLAEWKCYKFIFEKFDYTFSTDACHHLEAIVAEPRTEEENDAVRLHCPEGYLSNCWIGLKRSEGGNYLWSSDNTSLSWANWAENEPGRVGDCVKIDNQGFWKRSPCSYSRSTNAIPMPICQKHAPITYPSDKLGLVSCEGRKDGDLLPDSNNCQNYHVCRQGQSIAQTCEIGMLFNPTSLYCEVNQTVDCDTRIRCVDRQHGDKLADPDHCNKFYQCHHGKALSMTCSSGMYFNQNSMLCQLGLSKECQKEQIDKKKDRHGQESGNATNTDEEEFDASQFREKKSRFTATWYLVGNGILVLGLLSAAAVIMLFYRNTRNAEHATDSESNVGRVEANVEGDAQQSLSNEQNEKKPTSRRQSISQKPKKASKSQEQSKSTTSESSTSSFSSSL